MIRYCIGLADSLRYSPAERLFLGGQYEDEALNQKCQNQTDHCFLKGDTMKKNIFYGNGRPAAAIGFALGVIFQIELLNQFLN